jgi:Zn finger protein HypA/HybF involved in hydrogenase expression
MKPVSEAGLAPYNMENACFKCHKDIHNGQFREPDSLAGQVNCARCHSPEGWTALLFKHDRDAKFRLEGAHEKVTCTECHKTTKGDRGEDYVVYRPLSTACESCHGGTAPVRDQRKRQP